MVAGAARDAGYEVTGVFTFPGHSYRPGAADAAARAAADGPAGGAAGGATGTGGAAVTRLLRAELFKVRTTPGPWTCLIVTLLLTALGIVLSFLVAHRGTVHFGAPTSTHDLRDLVGAGFTAGTVMAPVLGVLVVTTEYRHKVLTATLLIEPRRARVLAAKVLAAAVWGVLLCIGSLALVAAMGIPLLVTQGGSLPHLLDQVAPVVPGLVGAYALLAVYGLGIGVLVRNQIAGVILALGITLILEPIVVALFGSLVHWDINWLPSRATQALAGGLTGGRADAGIVGTLLLSWWLGAMALLASPSGSRPSRNDRTTPWGYVRGAMGRESARSGVPSGYRRSAVPVYVSLGPRRSLTMEAT